MKLIRMVFAAMLISTISSASYAYFDAWGVWHEGQEFQLNQVDPGIEALQTASAIPLCTLVEEKDDVVDYAMNTGACGRKINTLVHANRQEATTVEKIITCEEFSHDEKVSMCGDDYSDENCSLSRAVRIVERTYSGTCYDLHQQQ